MKWTLGRKKNQRIAALVGSVIENSSETIAMDTQTRRAFLLLQQFLFDAVYTNPVAKSEESKAENVVKSLYASFISHGEKLPTEYALFGRRKESIRRCAIISPE